MKATPGRPPALFNRYAEAEFVHKKLSEADFIAQFVTSDERVTKINLAAKADNGVLLGFANGCVKKGADIGYITFVLVEKEYRRQGIARQLLAELEKSARRNCGDHEVSDYFL